MYLGSPVLPFFIYFTRAAAMTLAVVRQDIMTSLFIQPSASGAPSVAFDWWPYDNFWESLTLQPSLTSTSSSQSPTITTSSPLPSQTPLSSPPLILDITALPPSTTNAPHPRIRTKENLKPFSLAPVFVIAGLVLGILVGLPTFNSYERWVTKRAAIPLLPGPAYVPVGRICERMDAESNGPTIDVHGSPSKHTRHGNPYSSYPVGRGLLGRIPSSMFRASPPSLTQEKTGTEKTFAWPSLPHSSRSTPSQSRSVTCGSTKSTRAASVIPDDPFTSTGVDTKSPTIVAASRASTRSTFAHPSRFGEMWSDEEFGETSVIVSPVSPILPPEGEGEVRTGLFKKIRSKSRSVKGKQREEKSTSNVSEPAPPAKASSPKKGNWNFPWAAAPPLVESESYTSIPARTSSPRSQSFRTPESSPRKLSYVYSNENVRMVDTSVLPASPPTLTSPRLESEFFLNATGLDVSGAPTPQRMRSSRAVSRLGKGKERNNTDPIPSSSHPDESKRFDDKRSFAKHDSRPGPSRVPSATSIPLVSEFPGDPPPKRSAAERFYARRSALDKVEEIIQRSRSQTDAAMMSPTLDGVQEGRRFGRAGREFESGGIEQRLFEP